MVSKDKCISGVLMQKAKSKIWQIAKAEQLGWFLIGLGGLLRIRQYLHYRSLWGDEASLAFNLVNRSFVGLTKLLDYHQAAPVGFLFIEKLFIILFFDRKQFVIILFPQLFSKF